MALMKPTLAGIATGILQQTSFFQIVAFASSQSLFSHPHPLSTSLRVMLVFGSDALEVGMRGVSFHWTVFIGPTVDT